MPSDIQTDEETGFVAGMKALLGLDPQQVNKLLLLLDADEVVDLADAVGARDRAHAEAIVRRATLDEDDADARALISTLDEVPKGKDDLEEGDDDAYPPLSPGDRVRVGKEKGVVKVGDAAGDLVGVSFGGKMKMIPRRRVARVDEAVLGMVGVPNISRLQQLAGVQPEIDVVDQPDSEDEVIDVATPEGDEAVDIDIQEDDGDDDLSPSDVARRALDDLKRVFPDLRVSDIRTVRASLNSLLSQLNESLTETGVGRRKKL